MKLGTRVDCKVVHDTKLSRWQATVEECPFCGEQHEHSGGKGGRPLLGARRAPCNQQEYRLHRVEEDSPGDE